MYVFFAWKVIYCHHTYHVNDKNWTSWSEISWIQSVVTATVPHGSSIPCSILPLKCNITNITLLHCCCTTVYSVTRQIEKITKSFWDRNSHCLSLCVAPAYTRRFHWDSAPICIDRRLKWVTSAFLKFIFHGLSFNGVHVQLFRQRPGAARTSPFLWVTHTRSSSPRRSVSCDSGSCCPGRRSPFRKRWVGSRVWCSPCPCDPSSWSRSASCAPWWCRSCAGGPRICRCSSAASLSRRSRSPDPVRSRSAPAPSESRASTSGLS